MIKLENDFTFARVLYGNPVPFGMAGDCFSSQNYCQQARLNVNLKGTNFKIADNVKWVDYGEKPLNKIFYTNVNYCFFLNSF
jgi:hypothetical protein